MPPSWAIPYPVSICEQVWHRYVDLASRGNGDVASHAGDLLLALGLAMKVSNGASCFEVITSVALPDTTPWLPSETKPTRWAAHLDCIRIARLKAAIECDEDGWTVVSLSLPDEDCDRA